MIFVGILGGVFVILIILLTRSVTTLIHELGHALPSLAFTDEDVTIYVGSYGDIQRSTKIKIGRLTSYLTLNMLGWNLGLCSHKPSNRVWKEMIIVLGGPLFSVLLALPLIYFLRNYEVNQYLRFVMGVYAVSAFWDLFVNLLPDKNPMVLHDGSTTYNDGYHFLQLFNYTRLPESLYSAAELKHEKKYSAALAEYKATLKSGYHDKAIYHDIIECQVGLRNYSEADHYMDEMKERYKLNEVDFAKFARIHFQFEAYVKAIRNYNYAIDKAYNNTFLLNERGAAYNTLGEHRKAITDFDVALDIDPTMAIAYTNRGYAKIQSGKWDEGLLDINQSLALDNQNPYTHFYHGIYFVKVRQYQDALRSFNHAKTLKPFIPEIESAIEELQSWMN